MSLADDLETIQDISAHLRELSDYDSGGRTTIISNEK